MVLAPTPPSDGGFSQPTSIYFGDLTLADVNGDTRLDIVATAAQIPGGGGSPATPGGIYLLKGAGNGTFTVPGSPSNILGPFVYNLGVGDFDKDGKLDFVAATSASQNQASALKVVWGDGTFSPATTPTTVSTVSTGVCPLAGSFGSNGPIPLSVGDANGDGRTDIFLFYTNAVLIADGTRSFLAPVSIDLTPGNGSASHADAQDAPPFLDLNGDGHADVVANGYSQTGPDFNIGLLNVAGNQSW